MAWKNNPSAPGCVFRQSRIPHETKQAVLNVRRQNSTFGKSKIAIRALGSKKVAGVYLKVMPSLGNTAPKY